MRRWRTEAHAEHGQSTKTVSEFLGQEIIQNGVDRAVEIEEDAHGDVDEPVGLEADALEEAGYARAEHDGQIPDLERKQAYVEGEEHAHEHEYELTTLFDVLL